MRCAPAALLVLGACGADAATSPAAEPRVVVVTQVPAGAAGFAPDPRSRWPDGSRLVRVDLARPDVAPRVLTDGLAAAGGADVSADGARIAFVAKASESDRFAVWTCAADGSVRAKVFEGAADCGSAAFLANGCIVFSAGEVGAHSLFVVDAEGGDARRITFSGGDDVDPTPLADGRVAFAGRAPGAGDYALFSVHVDGTGVAPLRGSARACALLVEPTAKIDAGAAASPQWRAGASAPLAPHKKPQGHLSVVDLKATWGGVFCVDARPIAGAGAADARRVRFATIDGGPRVVGDVPLESDGSFYVRVPPDVPLSLEVLDADGRVVGAQRTPFWVRPGETRGCVGCHEDPDTTPPNVRPRAVLAEPVQLGLVRATEETR